MKRRFVNTAIGIAVLCLAGTSMSARAAGEFSKYPIAIKCSVGGVWHVLYLDRISANGDLNYLTPSRRGFTIPKGGVVKLRGTIGIGNCGGKSLAQLKADGQTLYIK